MDDLLKLVTRRLLDLGYKRSSPWNVKGPNFIGLSRTKSDRSPRSLEELTDDMAERAWNWEGWALGSYQSFQSNAAIPSIHCTWLLTQHVAALSAAGKLWHTRALDAQSIRHKAGDADTADFVHRGFRVALTTALARRAHAQPGLNFSGLIVKVRVRQGFRYLGRFTNALKNPQKWRFLARLQGIAATWHPGLASSGLASTTLVAFRSDSFFNFGTEAWQLF